MDKRKMDELMEYGDNGIQILGDIESMCNLIGDNTLPNEEVDIVDLRMAMRGVGRLASLVHDDIEEMCAIALHDPAKPA